MFYRAYLRNPLPLLSRYTQTFRNIVLLLAVLYIYYSQFILWDCSVAQIQLNLLETKKPLKQVQLHSKND